MAKAGFALGNLKLLLSLALTAIFLAAAAWRSPAQNPPHRPAGPPPDTAYLA